MLELLADENFKDQIVSGLRRRLPTLDLSTARQHGLLGATDPEILEWAAHEHLVVLTHDVRTMGRYAFARIEAGELMPGVIEIPSLMPIGQAIEELVLFVQVVEPREIRGRVVRLPL